MSAITFTLKKVPAQRVDLSPLSSHLIAGMAPSEINGISLVSGKQRIRVDELFNVSGETSDRLIFKNACDKLDRIGCDMQGGEILIEGDAGAYLGQGMRDGKIVVDGNAGAMAGCEMRGGLLQINGNVGDQLGSELPGNKKGMQGGMIIVKGNCGDRVGDLMRRGTILVEGNVGDYCGTRMIAGTIAVMGNCGSHIGYGMNRGTLLLWNSPQIPASFVDCGFHTATVFLALLFKSFRGLETKFAQSGVEFHRVRRYGGDLAARGLGEILVKIQ